VASIPWKDPAHVRTDPVALRRKEQDVSAEALGRFDALPKPVLLHCSAGIDRSSPVAAFIREQRI
jgi:protein tyrosine/serine phosphatase